MTAWRRLLCIWVGSLVFFASPSAHAQPAAVERDLSDAKALYDAGRFEDAIPKLLAVVAQLQNLQEEKRRTADAHFLLGLSYFAMRDESATLANFRQVLALDPQRTIDSEIFSPRIVALFERVRGEANPERVPDERRNQAVESAPSRGGPGGSQTRMNLPVGARLRLQLNQSDQRVQGTLLSLSDQSFAIMGTENRSVSFPRTMVARVQIVSGKKRHYLTGLVVGSVFGVVSGVFDDPCFDDGTCSRAGTIAAEGVGFGLIGMLVGTLFKSERWLEVPMDRLVNVPPAAPDAKRP